MGMSASQARFLGLTSRKSNVEYQGQQVNQQRSSLANESAGLFNQMLALQVPTPPSAVDFYSMSYSFPGESPNESYQILSWDSSTEPTIGAYDVTVKRTVNDAGVKNPYLPTGTTISYSEDNKDTDGNYIYTISFPNSSDGYALQKSNTDARGLKNGDRDYVPSYSYQIQTVNGVETRFIAASLLEEMFVTGSSFNPTLDEDTGITTATIPNDQAASESYYKKENTVTTIVLHGVTMEVDDTGRFTGMTYPVDGNHQNMRAVNLELKEIHDDKGYEEAMQDYNYKKMMYDRAIEDINTRTEIIQKQDQNLELRLKQLDTEQKAISTEMDAVKEIIKKNVEGTFKTFA